MLEVIRGSVCCVDSVIIVSPVLVKVRQNKKPLFTTNRGFDLVGVALLLGAKMKASILVDELQAGQCDFFECCG